MKKELKGFASIEILVVLTIIIIGGGVVWLLNDRNNVVGKDEMVTVSPSPTPKPTLVPLVTPFIHPVEVESSIALPKYWEKNSGQDLEFGLETSLYLPRGYVFKFSGSEWYLTEEYDESPEDWTYETSIFMGNDEEVKNYYDGDLAWVWLQRNLDGEFGFRNYKPGEIQITDVTEHKMDDNRSYFEVRTQARYLGNERTYFLYVQNNILHMLIPNGRKAESSKSRINPSLGVIFNSLVSKRL